MDVVVMFTFNSKLQVDQQSREKRFLMNLARKAFYAISVTVAATVMATGSASAHIPDPLSNPSAHENAGCSDLVDAGEGHGMQVCWYNMHFSTFGSANSLAKAQSSATSQQNKAQTSDAVGIIAKVKSRLPPNTTGQCTYRLLGASSRAYYFDLVAADRESMHWEAGDPTRGYLNEGDYSVQCDYIW
ncbi:hypothetical protein [Streptomyces sp. NPDC055109]